ncbi:GNAT family N-acetyltransferase [Aneurinibacillus soli]|nr:GNAT family N-acetyltransferase [Aneurinibacillus soli]
MITRQNITADDDGFLYQVYKETREEELRVTGWSEEEQDSFLRMQFDMQRRSYALQHDGADHMIILFDQVRIGQIMTKTTDDSIWIIDVALLATYRNKGIGTHLILDIQQQAKEIGKSVRLHVLYNNQVRNLYARLGFQVTEEKPPYFAMEWCPNQKLQGSKERRS